MLTLVMHPNESIPRQRPRTMFGTERVTIYRARSAWEQRWHAKIRGRLGKVRTVHAMSKAELMVKVVRSMYRKG